MFVIVSLLLLDALGYCCGVFWEGGGQKSESAVQSARG